VYTHVLKLTISPLGGYKESGIGRELGEAALANYLQSKSVAIRMAGPMY
jgi:aldehyde dehydrogenase (NAD+)